MQADEPAPVGNYDQSKREEEKRLLTLHECLQSLALQLQPHDEYVTSIILTNLTHLTSTDPRDFIMHSNKPSNWYLDQLLFIWNHLYIIYIKFKYLIP